MTTQPLPDHLNPAYIFSGTASALLMKIARGEIDARALAIDTLAGRGQDPNTGLWCGFESARQRAAALKANG